MSHNRLLPTVQIVCHVEFIYYYQKRMAIIIINTSALETDFFSPMDLHSPVYILIQSSHSIPRSSANASLHGPQHFDKLHTFPWRLCTKYGGERATAYRSHGTDWKANWICIFSRNSHRFFHFIFFATSHKYEPVSHSIQRCNYSFALHNASCIRREEEKRERESGKARRISSCLRAIVKHRE